MTTLNIKIPSQEALDNAFRVLALANLKSKKESTNIGFVEKEAARICRMTEHFYKLDKTVLFDYPQFAANFLKENFKDIVFGTKYDGLFVDDILDNKEPKMNAYINFIW